MDNEPNKYTTYHEQSRHEMRVLIGHEKHDTREKSRRKEAASEGEMEAEPTRTPPLKRSMLNRLWGLPGGGESDRRGASGGGVSPADGKDLHHPVD